MSTNVNKILKTLAYLLAYCKLYLGNYIKLMLTTAFEFINYQLYFIVFLFIIYYKKVHGEYF